MSVDAPHASAINVQAPSLRALSYLLRHREFWPADFRWDYRSFARCAVGLAFAQWPLRSTQYRPTSESMTSNFGMPIGDARKIFGGGAFRFWDFIRGRVTPEQVADKIDAYLAA